MKLELKHLAPYLPYRLGIFDPTSNTTKIIYWDKSSNHFKGINEVLSSKVYKPILRPLSELYRPKWVQKKMFNHLHYNNHLKLPLHSEGYKWHRIEAHEIWSDYETLFKHHFDVFGLIDKGLAVDKNTLKDG